jgi:dihydropteroate synthase
MNQHSAEFIQICSLADARREILAIGSDANSIDIMAPKAVHKTIRLQNITVQDAVIIKQDMLSIGGEVAIPKDAFQLKESSVSILLLGTVAQLTFLVEKLHRHYPRLQRIAAEINGLLAEIK